MTGEPTSSPGPSGEERDWLAAEYALGLLDGEALAQAQRLIASDPAFRRSVGAWTGRLAPLLDEVEPASPPAALWERLAPQLTGGEARAAAPKAANDNAHLQRKISLWRGYAAAATALAASLAFFLVLRPAEAPAPLAPPAAAPAQAPLVAMLEAKDSPTRLVATYEPASHSLVVMPAAGLTRAAGHSHQLWLIPAGGTPQPLGIVVPGTPLRLAMPAADASIMAAQATLAVSVEPTGGSPTGLPTGPVIAAGKLVRT